MIAEFGVFELRDQKLVRIKTIELPIINGALAPKDLEALEEYDSRPDRVIFAGNGPAIKVWNDLYVTKTVLRAWFQ